MGIPSACEVIIIGSGSGSGSGSGAGGAAAAYRLAISISADDLEPYYDEAEHLLGVRTLPCELGLRKILDRLSVVDDAWTSKRATAGLRRRTDRQLGTEMGAA